MKYQNILEHFTGSIWALTPTKMEEIVGFINGLNSESIVDLKKSAEQTDKSAERYTVRGGVAVVPIRGTIFHRANLLQNFSGGTSTEHLISDLKAIRDDKSIHSVVLSIDSPGGAVGGLSEAAGVIRDMRKSKRVVSHADGNMASAAYYIGSAASKVYLTPNSSVGSIGVFGAVPDYSEAHDKDGIKYTIFRSTPLKGAGNGMEPLTADMVDDIQRLIDAHHAEFVRNISLNRNINMEDAQKMGDARMHIGEGAVEAGFADGVMSLDDVMEMLTDDASHAEQNELLLAEYGKMEAALTRATNDISALTEELAQLENAMRDQEAASLEAKIESAVTELTTGPTAKVAPMRADELRERLRADFEGTMDALSFVESGAAAPKDLDEKPKPEPSAKTGLVATTQAEADIYESFGLEYTKSF